LVNYQLGLQYDFAIDVATTNVARFLTIIKQLYKYFLAGVFDIVYDANLKTVGYLDVFDQKTKLSQKPKDIIYELELDLKLDIKVIYIATPDEKNIFIKEVKTDDALVGNPEFTSSVKGSQHRIIHTVLSLVTEPKDKKSRKLNDQKKRQLINALKQKTMDYTVLLSQEYITSFLIKVKSERMASRPSNALKVIEKFLS
ncbi:hypothetical protein CU098_003534, partial [Rhizopus stolonifer]